MMINLRHSEVPVVSYIATFIRKWDSVLVGSLPRLLGTPRRVVKVAGKGGRASVRRRVLDAMERRACKVLVLRQCTCGAEMRGPLARRRTRGTLDNSENR